MMVSMPTASSKTSGSTSEIGISGRANGSKVLRFSATPASYPDGPKGLDSRVPFSKVAAINLALEEIRR